MAGPALCLPLLTCPPPISAPLSYRLHFSLLYPFHHITSGPACHCGRSRLPSPFPTPYHSFSLLILFLSPSPTYIPLGLHSGPACHCGGPAISSYPGLSLKPPSSLSPLPISTYKPTPPPLQAPGPACHCGWSRLSPLPNLSLSSIHTPPLLL